MTVAAPSARPVVAAPIRSRPHWFDPVVAFLGALPTLAGAALGAGLAVDDWAFAAHSRYEGFLHAYGQQSLSRPIEGTWEWAEFKLLGTHPVPHMLLLAAVNAAAAVLLWRLLLRLVPRRIAVLTTLVWLALANKGSTHLWLTNSPHVFSLALMLGALLVATSGPPEGRRLAVAIGLLVLATFAYEGALAIGGLGLAILVWRDAPRTVRVRRAVMTLAILGAAGGWTLVTSPKLNGTHAQPFHDASHLLAAHFGSGVMPRWTILLTIVALVLVGWSLATLVLPSFATRIEERLVLVGLAILVLGALPFAVGGFPFSTDGFFDRGSLFADLGTALFYGAGLAMLWRLPWRPAAAVLAGAALVTLSVPGVSDVNNFARAQRDGQRFLRATDQLPAAVRTRGPVTFLPLASHGGVAMLVADYDVSSALALRNHTGWPYPQAQMAIPQTGYTGPKGPTYALVGRRLVPRPPP
jgi:hypothetical protein